MVRSDVRSRARSQARLEFRHRPCNESYKILIIKMYEMAPFLVRLLTESYKNISSFLELYLYVSYINLKELFIGILVIFASNSFRKIELQESCKKLDFFTL